jgi:hypothetical protein
MPTICQQRNLTFSLNVQVGSFFSSPDAIFACFWPTQTSSTSALLVEQQQGRPQEQESKQQPQQQQQQQQQESSSQGERLTTSSSNGSSATHAAADPMDCSDPNNQPQASSLAGQNPSSSSSKPNSSSSSSSNSQVDVDAIHSLYAALQATKSSGVLSAVNAASAKLVEHIWGTTGRGQLNPGFLRQAAVLLLNPQLEDTEQFPLVERLAVVLVGLPERAKEELLEMLKGWKERDLRM